MFVFVIIVYLVIGILEITPLVKQKMKKELILYSVLLSAAFIVTLLFSLGVKIPSLAKPLKSFVEAIFGSQQK